MGTRYNITLHASHAENAPEDGPPDFLAKVNAWLVARGGLEIAEFWEGSYRNTTCYVCTGCSRGLTAPDGFGEMFCGLPWNDPASAIAIVQPEFGPAVIFRPANPNRSATMPTEVPPNFREGIRDDGTVAGHVVETYYRRLERLELRAGYLAVISDDGAVDGETRIPLGMLREMLAALPIVEGEHLNPGGRPL